MSPGQTTGDRLRESRKRRGLSQRELARQSGVSISLIRKLEQGERQDTRTETLRKLAVVLGVPTTALLSGNRELPPVTAGPAWERPAPNIREPRLAGSAYKHS